MKIIIDIPESIREHIIDGSFGTRLDDRYTLVTAVMNGISPLKGKWINKKCRDECYLPCCSVCGESSGTLYEYNYCPNCGAEMDAEE